MRLVVMRISLGVQCIDRHEGCGQFLVVSANLKDLEARAYADIPARVLDLDAFPTLPRTAVLRRGVGTDQREGVRVEVCVEGVRRVDVASISSDLADAEIECGKTTNRLEALRHPDEIDFRHSRRNAVVHESDGLLYRAVRTLHEVGAALVALVVAVTGKHVLHLLFVSPGRDEEVEVFDLISAISGDIPQGTTAEDCTGSRHKDRRDDDLPHEWKVLD